MINQEAAQRRLPAYADIIYPVMDFNGGMNTKASSLLLSRDSAYSLQRNQPARTVNLVRTRSGALTTRPGRAKLVDSAISPPIGDAVVRSIYELRQSDGTQAIVITAGNSIYKYSGGAWVSLGTTASSNQRFLWAQLRDTIIGINGSDSMVYWDGTTFGTVATAPTTGTAIAVHADRVFVLDGQLLKYSALGDYTNWTGLDAGSIQIPVTQGQSGTGLKSLWDRLILWTNGEVFELLGRAPSLYQLIQINQRYGHEGSAGAIVAAGNDVYFINKRGVHALSTTSAQSVTGDVATNYVSGFIEDVWQDLATANFENIIAVDDTALNSMVILCSSSGALNSKAFVGDYYHLDAFGRPTWGEYSNMPFASVAEVVSLSNKPTLLFGGYDGFVYQQTSIETDDSAAIPISLDYLTDLEVPAFTKTFRHFVLYLAAPSGTVTLTSAYDFGARVATDSFPVPVLQLGDTIGETFTIGVSVLGNTALSFREFRRAIPGHGRFARFSVSMSVPRRVVIGGFIIFAGLRRMI